MTPEARSRAQTPTPLEAPAQEPEEGAPTPVDLGIDVLAVIQRDSGYAGLNASTRHSIECALTGFRSMAQEPPPSPPQEDAAQRVLVTHLQTVKRMLSAIRSLRRKPNSIERLAIGAEAHLSRALDALTSTPGAEPGGSK